LYKNEQLINQMEEILKQLSIQVVAWVLLASFSQRYNESFEQNRPEKRLKNFQFCQKSNV
jgi:hypothetical protein